MTRGAQGPTQRQLRVGEAIRHAIAWALERGALHDEVLANRAITVTEVRIGPDLRNATVYVTPLGGGEVRPALDALNRAVPYLRSLVGREVRLRYAPNLAFEADPTFDQVQALDTLLRSPEVARDLSPRDEQD